MRRLAGTRAAVPIVLGRLELRAVPASDGVIRTRVLMAAAAEPVDAGAGRPSRRP